MNHIYRVIYNASTATYQAVSEIGKSHSTSSSKTIVDQTPPSHKFELTLVKSALLALGLTALPALSAPTGGQVTAGVANIAQTGNITNINQSSQNAAINWQSFNVGKNETVNFNQPNAQSVTLNRVIGNERSVIDGAMNANGKVFISNANGMLIGKDVKINVGSLVATTANISDDDLMNGRYQFTGEGAGSIENLGHISVPKGGVVALVAPIVKNGGTITAHEGNVLLASAESFSITLPDNANFAYTLDKGTLQGLVDNGGAILADAGRVVLTAKGVDTVKKSLIKHSGKIEANTVQNKNGVIELLGDLDNTRLEVGGSLKAEGQGADKGGFVETSASDVKITESAVVSTKSTNGETGTFVIGENDLVVANDGTVTANDVKKHLENNNLTLKSINQEDIYTTKQQPADLTINEEINWYKNTLTLHAEKDVLINKTMNGVDDAKLKLEYGQNNSLGESNYYLERYTPLKDRTVKINLPKGKTFSTNYVGNIIDFEVVHDVPNTLKNKDYYEPEDFPSYQIAFGKDIDFSKVKLHEKFKGFYLRNNTHRDYAEKGEIHGLGHVFSNLNISQPEESDVGLFSYLVDTEIRDLGLNNFNIKGVNSVGGLLGSGAMSAWAMRGIDISNVYIKGNVVGQDYVGGLVGSIRGTVKNSFSIGDVTGTSKVGGLIGNTYGTSIENSHSHSNINSYVSKEAQDYQHNETAYNEFSSGIGGLVGKFTSSSVKNSHATGKIKSNRNNGVGGLLGWSLVSYSFSGPNGTFIENSYADVDIENTGKNTGGLVGASSYATIKNSYTTSNVTGGENTGGLIGSYTSVTYDDDPKHRSLSNSYVAGKVTSSHADTTGAVIGTFQAGNLAKGDIENTFFDKNITGISNAIGQYKPYDDQNNNIVLQSTIRGINMGNLIGKTTKEMQQKSTFTDWDFNTVWYMNEGSMPKLRAFATPLTINPIAQTTAGVKAPDLSKTYDGKAIISVDELRNLDGWKDNFDATGLATGDSVDGIFQAGTLTIDETKGDWKGAKDVKEGGYELYPTGTLKDEYQQKYIIEWNKGTLTIKPAKLTITAMNNIKPEGENNPDVSRIGVVVTGLVEGESISDVNLSYSDDKKWQGDISIIRVGEPVFKNGKASNYEITKKDGKLLTVQKGYDLKNITDKKPEDVAKIRDLLNAVEDEMLLAHAVYGSDDAKKGDNDRWYEIWEVKDKDSDIVVKELKPLGFKDKIPNDGKTYTKLYELIKDESFDYSDGVRYQITIKKDWAIDDTKIVTQAEYDELLKTTPKDNITINKTFRDGLYSATEPNGLNVGVYQKVGTDKKFIVFRGTDTGHAVQFNAIWSDEVDSDGGTNVNQVRGNLPKQYEKAKEITKNLISQQPNKEWGIIGHSLGGGLATYSSIHQDKLIRTVVFNQAQIQHKNLPEKYKNMWEKFFNERNKNWTQNDNATAQSEASNLTTSEMMKYYTNIGSFVVDNDALSKAKLSTTLYPSGFFPINFLGNTDISKIGLGSEQDHLMPHVIKTQQLADIMAKNNEILANCQSSDCQVLRQNRWTPSSSNLEKIDNKRVNTINKLTNEQNQVHQQISELERQGKNSERKQRDLDKINQKLEKATQAEVTSSGITVIRDNDTFSVKKNNGWQLKKGDIINTGNKKAKIYFPDGSWVELDKNTSIEITIEYNPNIQLDKPIASYISLLKGKILKEGTKK